MTSVLRRGGSAVAFTWNNAYLDEEFLAALAAHRFRSIERAASEEVSFGWVTPGDPSGETFARDDVASAGTSVRLRFRMDAKKFPASKLQMERASAERAKGRRLSARERRELKAGLHEQLLPGLLPRTQLVDVIAEGDRCLLLSSSRAARDVFTKLCHESFGFRPERLTSGALAGQMLTSEQVAKLATTKFPGRSPRQLENGNADFLGDEFLLWIWWNWATNGGEIDLGKGKEVGVVIDDRIEFAAANDETSLVLRHGLTARCQEALSALQQGRIPTRMRMILAEPGKSWTVTLDGATLALGSAKLPEDADLCESAEDRNVDRSGNWRQLQGTVEGMFSLFLEERTRGWKKISDQIARWMGGAS